MKNINLISSKELLISALSESKNFAECLEKLHLPLTSAAYRALKKAISKYNIDTSLYPVKFGHRKYSREILAPIVESSISYAQCLKKLGLRVAGGNYKLLQRNIDKFNIDCSHMLHQGATQGVELKLFENLCGNYAIKLRLVKYRGHECEKCLLKIWLDSPITLELEHVDGNNRNNTPDNLRLLCPNCHAQTSTWRGRKLKGTKK